MVAHRRPERWGRVLTRDLDRIPASAHHNPIANRGVLAFRQNQPRNEFQLAAVRAVLDDSICQGSTQTQAQKLGSVSSIQVGQVLRREVPICDLFVVEIGCGEACLRNAFLLCAPAE